MPKTSFSSYLVLSCIPCGTLAGKLQAQQFEALAQFANMGDTPDEWRRFNLRWPHFFPTVNTGADRHGFRTISEWIYTSAFEWEQQFARDQAVRVPTLPPLLWYRNHLRAVWTRNDPTGARLSVLLGFEEQAKALGYGDATVLIRPGAVPGVSLATSVSMAGGGLPIGRSAVNGITGEISWKFGCDLQQAVYDLMHSRWRAKVCQECGKYYVADKTAQTFCSTRCSGETKRKRALDWWNREGQKRRAKKQTATQRRSK